MIEQEILAEVENLVRTRIPTRHGEFTLYYYRNSLDDKEHIALVKGDVGEQSGVLVRVHSECFTGDVLGSRRCDCGEQLNLAIDMIGAAKCGVFVYLRQEGRGIGLLKKLKAYNLQDQGYDTVDANLELGHRADERDYRFAALILGDLAVYSVKLITNNPGKITELSALGITVEQRIPLEIQYNEDNFRYLETKAKKLHHLLVLDGKKTVSEPAKEYPFMENLMNRMQSHQQRTPCSPFVTLSYAQSIDGSIALENTSSCALSCQKSLTMTHWLRARHDALLVGVNTILVDDPKLSVRHCPGKNPQPVILDSVLRIPLNAGILNHIDTAPIIITTDRADNRKHQELTARGAKLYTVCANKQGRVDLKAALAILYELGFQSVMVEGGARVIDEFLLTRRADYCVITLVPKLIGGLKAMGQAKRPLGQAPLSITNCQYQPLGSDLIVHGAIQSN